MITLKEVERIHEILIDKFGGSKGIRDRGILESAINRPFQTFDQTELYPLPVDKAADGNKRTAYVLMRLILRENSLDIFANQDEKYEFVITAAKGEIKYEQIRQWLNNHIR